MRDIHWSSAILAQQPVDVIPAGDDAAPTGTTPSAPPGNGAIGAPSGTGAAPVSPGSNPMLLIVLLVVAMLVFTMWSSRRDRKKREALINAVKKHDRVQTIGGVIGSVVEVKPDYIVLKVDESSNTRITFARSAVQQVLTSSAELPSTKSD